jgi:hypothetical protein
MKFNDINFGYASAEKESIKSPELLLEGYFNINNISDKSISGDEFLFLGRSSCPPKKYCGISRS